LSASWNSNNELWGAGLFGSHVSDVFEPTVTNSAGDFYVVDSMTTVNAYVTRYDLIGPNSSLRLGINNLFDEDPPLASEAFGFEGELHSSRARYFFLSLRKEFN
ncbi:MAG: TonB-dependent receptor, partial [Proteobacteria bacterium]|nr:TonB-dependent receptor [Pseudomonadota bacterium]